MKPFTVMTEEETLDAILAGRSITRVGDGEFKMALGHSLKQQEHSKDLQERLLHILTCMDPSYLVAIPRIVAGSPKEEYWARFMPVVEDLIRTNYTYGSALITRPDNCPWIDNNAYYTKVEQIWRGKHIAYIWGGTRKSFMPTMFGTAKRVDSIESLPRHAWGDRGRFLKVLRKLDPKPEVVLIALGPTATAVIPDIVKMGMQAIDIGHLGGYMRRFFAGTSELPKTKDFVWPAGAEAYGGRYIYRTRDLEYAINKCTKRRAVIQAGGHVGIWPKHLAKYFGEVHTFEPDFDNFTCMTQNLEGEGVHMYMAALGDSHDPIKMTYHPNNIGGHHVSGAGNIPQMMIDDLQLAEVDLIVLDIEGSELAAIRGAENTIKRTKPVLHLEMRGHIEKYKRGTTAELHDLLVSWGYEKSAEVNNDTVYVPAKSV